MSAARTHWGRRGQEKYTERSALVPFKLTRALGVAQASLQERQAGAISVGSGQLYKRQLLRTDINQLLCLGFVKIEIRACFETDFLEN